MLEKESITTDVLVVGSGVSGLKAALAARTHGVSVTVAAKGRGASIHYDAVNAPFGHADPRDNENVYYQDILRSGGHINHKDLARRLASEAVPSIQTLESLGIRFDRIEGRYVQRLVSGGSYRRALYIQDRAGREIGNALRKEAERQAITFYSSVVVIELLQTEDRIAGALALDLKHSRLLVIHAKAVVVAAGGIGHLYPFSSYPDDIIGQGVTLAYRAGAELVDMEFIQFEPTGVYYPESVRGLLIPTAMFGEGGILLNKQNHRFVTASPFRAEVNAHKHDLDLLIAGEVQADRGSEHGGVYFDGTAIPSAVLGSYPHRQKRLRAAGIDLKRDRVEVGPVAHSLIGGVWMDSDCSCSMRGLFAAGEAAGGVHGANRMAGNGGAETIVFGKIAGDTAGKFAAASDLPTLSDDEVTLGETCLKQMVQTERTGKLRVQETTSEIQTLVATAAGVIRNGREIAAALDRLDEIKVEKLEHLFAEDFSDLIRCLEVKDAALLAEIVLGAARRRCESRGAHYRSDFPDVDDETWRKNIIVKKNADGSVGFQIRKESQ